MMTPFLTLSQLARVTSLLGHHYRSSLGLFSTTPKMKVPAFGNPSKYLKRMEERNEKHRKVQQLVKDVVTLSCESTAKGGVCDVYVVGVTHYTPESCRETQAIMSYLKPQVLFLELCEGRSYMLHEKKWEVKEKSIFDGNKDEGSKSIGREQHEQKSQMGHGKGSKFSSKMYNRPNGGRGEMEGFRRKPSAESVGSTILQGLNGTSRQIFGPDKHVKLSVRDIGQAILEKRLNLYGALRAWNFDKYASKYEASEFYVAYQEAMKYGCKVVLGDRPIEVTSNRVWRKMSLWQKTYTLCLGYFGIVLQTIKGTLEWEVRMDERDKYMAHRLLEVARKNSSIVAIVGSAHLEGIKKYWKHPIKVEDLMTIPSPSNSYLQFLGVAVAGVATIILVIYFFV